VESERKRRQDDEDRNAFSRKGTRGRKGGRQKRGEGGQGPSGRLYRCLLGSRHGGIGGQLVKRKGGRVFTGKVTHGRPRGSERSVWVLASLKACQKGGVKGQGLIPGGHPRKRALKGLAKRSAGLSRKTDGEGEGPGIGLDDLHQTGWDG